MPEPTLSLKLIDYEAQVGDFLGYGVGANFSDTTWTAKMQRDVTRAVESGLRCFYFPSPLDGVESYDWSFLRPVASLTLASGGDSVLLPVDYNGLEGDVVLPGANRYPRRLRQYGEAMVRLRQAELPDTTGEPQLFAVQPLKPSTGTTGQRYQLVIWPTADAAYTLQLTYSVSPDYLTSAEPYAYGGGAHSETILASCIAAAELYRDDARGPRWEYFRERLATSISMDRRHKAQVGGYVGDRSDARAQMRRRWGWPDPVTVNGVEY